MITVTNGGEERLNTNNNHAGWRNLKVEVNKKDVQVRAREGFFVTNATVNPDTTRVSELTNALACPLEGTGVPMILKWTGITEEGTKKKAAFSVWIPPAGLTLEGSQQLHVNFRHCNRGLSQQQQGRQTGSNYGPDGQHRSFAAAGRDDPGKRHHFHKEFRSQFRTVRRSSCDSRQSHWKPRQCNSAINGELRISLRRHLMTF